MAALCATDERKAVMNFTKTYCDSGQVVMINKETSPKEITSVDDLAGGDYKVAVEKGTASHLYVQNNGFPDSCIEVHVKCSHNWAWLIFIKVEVFLLGR